MDQSKDSRKAQQPFSYAAAAKRGQRSGKIKSASVISSEPASASKPATPVQKKQPESPRPRKPTVEPQQATWPDEPPPTRPAWGSSQTTDQAPSDKKQPQYSDVQWTDAPLPSTPAWGLRLTPQTPSQQQPQSPEEPFISPAQELLAKHLEAANKTPSPEKQDVTRASSYSSKQRLEAWFKQRAVSTTSPKLTYAQAIASSSSEENNPPSTSQHRGSPAPSQSSTKSQLLPNNRSSIKTQTEIQTPVRALSPIKSQPSARARSPPPVVPFRPAAQPSTRSQPASRSQSPDKVHPSGRTHPHAKSRSASGIQLPTRVPSSAPAQLSLKVQSSAQVLEACGNQPSAQAQLPTKPRSSAQTSASTDAPPPTGSHSPVNTLSPASLLSPTKTQLSAKARSSVVGAPSSTRNRKPSQSPSPVKAQLLTRIHAITPVSAFYNRSPSTKAQTSGRAPSHTKHQPSATGPSAPRLQSQVGRQSPTKSQPPVRGRSHFKSKSAPQAQLATTIKSFTRVERIENRPRSTSLPFSYIAAVRNNVPAAEKILPSRTTTPPPSSPAFDSRQGYRQTGGVEPEIIYPQTPTHQNVGAYGDDTDEGSPTPRASARKLPGSSGSSTPTQTTWSAKEKAAAAQTLAMAHQFELIERVKVVLAEQSNMKRQSPGHKRPSSDSGILPKRTASRTQPGFNSAGASPIKGSKSISRKGKDREILIPRVLPPVVRRGGFFPFDMRYDEQQHQQQQQHQQEQSAALSLPPPTGPPSPEPLMPALPTPPGARPTPSQQQEKQHPSPPRVPNPAATRAALTNLRILQLALKRALRWVGSWEAMTGDGHDEDRYWRRAEGQFFCAFDEESHEVAGLGQGRPRHPNPNRRARHMRRHLVLSPRGRHAWRPDAEAPVRAPAPPPPPAPAVPLSPIREEEDAAESSSSSVGPASSEVGSAASPVVVVAVPSPPAAPAAASSVAAVPAVVPSLPPAAASFSVVPAVPVAVAVAVAAPASLAVSSPVVPTTPSSPPPPVESAASFTPVAAPTVHVSPADSVDTHIGVILSSEERRRRAAMRRALTSNWSLWEHQYGWDVLVRRRDQTWRLHREVLSTQSVYFRGRLAGQGPWVVDCDLHERWQLGSALAFMYLGRYEGSGLTPGQPLDGIPVYRNVAAYVAGASVDCPSMMAFAVRALEEIRAALIPVVLTGLFRDDPDVHLFHEPLRLALADMYAQSDGSLMEPLRLAMARLVDVVLVSLWGNDAFQVVKHEKWMEKLFPLCYYDSVRFHQSGLLVGPVSWDRMEILSLR